MFSGCLFLTSSLNFASNISAKEDRADDEISVNDFTLCVCVCVSESNAGSVVRLSHNAAFI